MGQAIRYEDFSAHSRASGEGEEENVELMLARARGQARAEGFTEGAAEAEARFDAELSASIDAVGEALNAAIADDESRRRALGGALREVVGAFLTAFAPRLAALNLVDEIAASVAEAADDVNGGFVVELAPASRPGVVEGLGDLAASAVFRTNETLSPAEARVHWNGGFDEIDAAGAVARAIDLIDARLAEAALPAGEDPNALNAEDTFAAFDGSHDAEADLAPEVEPALTMSEEQVDEALPHSGEETDAPDDRAQAPDLSVGDAQGGDAGIGFDMPATDDSESAEEADLSFGGASDFGMDLSSEGSMTDTDGLSGIDAGSADAGSGDTAAGREPDDVAGPQALSSLPESEMPDLAPLDDAPFAPETPSFDPGIEDAENGMTSEMEEAFAPLGGDAGGDDDFPAVDFGFDALGSADDETPPQ